MNFLSLLSSSRSLHLVQVSIALLLFAMSTRSSNAWIPSSSSSFQVTQPSRRTKSRLFFVKNHHQNFPFSPSFQSTTTQLYEEKEDGGLGGIINSFFQKTDESKIPAELKDEIYRAEANTEAAKERGTRVIIYGTIAAIGILCAFFNVFLSELRADGIDGSPGVNLADAGFGWTGSNFLFSFIFLNKIGGGISLLGGFGAGLLAEIEYDTKRVNAEKIYEEMVRRREQKEKKVKKKLPKVTKSKKKKKQRSGKETKRLSALSEVLVDDTTTQTTTKKEQQSTTAAAAASSTIPTTEKQEEESTAASTENNDDDKKEDDKGIIAQMKGFYEKADNMAASQALLLNKQLEDAGMIEKITDETGLKVIGREEAQKEQENKKKQEKESE